jgi:large subunit ribosomal protein L4
LDRDKKKVGSLELNDKVFSIAWQEKQVAVYETVRMQTAGWRAGTHATKTVSTISGGNSKPFHQKGTGRARRGTTRAGICRGGYVILGPQPRDYSYTVPTKKRRLAVKAVLSERFQNGNIFVVREFNFNEIKTKEALKLLKKTWNIPEALIITGDSEDNFIMSVRNIPEYLVLHFTQVNLYDVLAYRSIIMTEEAAKYINEVYAS